MVLSTYWQTQTTAPPTGTSSNTWPAGAPAVARSMHSNQSFGAQVNAFTLREQTVYYARTSARTSLRVSTSSLTSAGRLFECFSFSTGASPSATFASERRHQPRSCPLPTAPVAIRSSASTAHASLPRHPVNARYPLRHLPVCLRQLATPTSREHPIQVLPRLCLDDAFLPYTQAPRARPARHPLVLPANPARIRGRHYVGSALCCVTPCPHCIGPALRRVTPRLHLPAIRAYLSLHSACLHDSTSWSGALPAAALVCCVGARSGLGSPKTVIVRLYSLSCMTFSPTSLAFNFSWCVRSLLIDSDRS